MLPPEVEKRVRAEAIKRGVDPDKAIAHANEIAAKSSAGKGTPDAASASADTKILIGHLPWIRVFELRDSLGLDRIADDELLTGEFLAKHGGAASAQPADATASAA